MPCTCMHKDCVLANRLHVLSSNAHNRVGSVDVANEVLCLCLCSALACALQRDVVFVGSAPHGAVISHTYIHTPATD
jgi:hypothetical protein